MSLKLVAVDMDSTFLRDDKSYDVGRFKRVLEQCKEHGIKFVIASGNSYHQLRDFFDEADKEYLYFAGDNGSYVVQQEVLQHEIAMTRALALDIVAFLEPYADVSVFISTGDQSYILRDDPFYEIAKIYNGILEEVDSFVEIPEAKMVTKVCILSHQGLAYNKAVAEAANAEFPDIMAVTSGNVSIDIIHRQSGKGFAIDYLQKRYDLAPDECMAFGDSMNDLSMMRGVKYSVAMSNADPHLAEHCAYEIGSNEEQAVLTVLERYFKEESLGFMEEYLHQSDTSSLS